MRKDKVVYIHRNPKTLEIYYVGMGEPSRAYRKSSRNKWWKNTYAKYGRIVDVVAKDLSVEDAYELEMLLISEIGRKDNGLGSLVNLDDGGIGTKGHIPTKSARSKLKLRNSKKVINTETLEILSSGAELLDKYSVYNDKLLKDNPRNDWMYLEDYEKGKHLTERWINRYKVRKSYVKIINVNTLEIFYNVQDAFNADSSANCYNPFCSKLKGSKKNNTDSMYYEDYENGRHLTEEWLCRKEKRKREPKPCINIEIYDFKEQVWFKTTRNEFKLKYNTAAVADSFMRNKRFCRREFFERDIQSFYKNQCRWKNILDEKTGVVERFNQWYLADKLNVKPNNVSNFMLGKCKTLYKRYKIVD